ncbi:SRPBCC family protein [Nocardia donostiensis]|nr:SRPBCC domain-containing protein [Nocardia donostiensis]
MKKAAKMHDETTGDNDLTSIVIDQFYPHPPEKVWRALTTPNLMAQWIMEPVGFAPVKGQHFTFKATPIPATRFSGDIACEVLDISEQQRLRISWTDANAASPYGWTVTWDLHPEGKGTRVILTHSGFDPDDPVQQHARTLMSGGWPTVVRRLDAALETLP